MFPKLSWKLTFFMVLVSTLTIISAGVMIDRALDKEFSNYLDVSQQERNKQIVEVIETLYQESGDWAAVSQHIQALSLLTDAEITVVDQRGGHMMNADRGGHRHRMMMESQTTEQVVLSNGTEATIHVTPVFRPEAAVNESQFRETVNGSIKTAALFSFGAALVVSAVVSLGLTKPLGQLMTTVRQVGQGDLKQRVEVVGDDEISWLGREFNQMAENLSQLERLRVKLTNDIAHELRTPLTNVQAYVEAMWDGLMPANRENLGLVQEEVNRLKLLLEDLQKLAKAEAPLYVREEIDLSNLVETLVGSLQILAEEKGIGLELAVSPNVFTEGDPKALGTAVENIIVNAIKYTPDGGKVRAVSLVEKNWSIVEVSDTGMGIEAQELPFIFERFYRTDSSRSRETGGTGIGLAIAYEVVQRHGGAIAVESEPGKGSTFTIRLPRI